MWQRICVRLVTIRTCDPHRVKVVEMTCNVLKGNDDMADKAGIAQIVPKWQPMALVGVLETQLAAFRATAASLLSALVAEFTTIA